MPSEASGKGRVRVDMQSSEAHYAEIICPLGSSPLVEACVIYRDHQHSWPERAFGSTLKANVDGQDQNKTLYLFPFASEKRWSGFCLHC